MAKKRIGANRRQKMAVKRSKKRVKKSGFGKVLFNGIKITVGLSCLAAAGFWGVKKAAPYMEKFDFLKIQNVTVNGNKYVTTSDIMSLASIEKGIFMLDLKIGDIRKKVRNIPLVEKVSIKRRIPNTLMITISERKPIAFVNIGSVYMTDRDGYLWPLKPNTYWNLPLISGLKDTVADGGPRRLTDASIEKMSTFFSEAKKIHKNLTHGIAQVDFSNDDYVLMRLESIPTKIALNSAAIGKSLRNLCGILKTIEGVVEKSPEHINLSYTNIAFVR